MARYEKLIDSILTGKSDKNIRFSELCNLLVKLGFKERIKGSHHIYFQDKVEEIINIQEIGGMAKPYQIRQVREIIIKYKLNKLINDEV